MGGRVATNETETLASSEYIQGDIHNIYIKEIRYILLQYFLLNNDAKSQQTFVNQLSFKFDFSFSQRMLHVGPRFGLVANRGLRWHRGAECGGMPSFTPVSVLLVLGCDVGGRLGFTADGWW